MNPKDHSSAGSFIRWQARMMVRVYYSRIEFSGGEHIDPTGSVLLCANHPNSLLDPMMIGLAARRPVRFFAKAPLFEKRFLGPIMNALGMIPAYRGQDDRKQVRKNLESLDKGIDALVEGGAVGIFPEGKSHDKEQVEMVRGGAARMALRAVDRGATALQVVPIGINYQRKEQFRSDVWVQVAEPISMDQWISEHAEEAGNERQLARCFTQELQRRLETATIHLHEHEWQPWLDDLEWLAPKITLDAPTEIPTLRKRKRIADAMNYFLKNDRDTALAVADEIAKFREQVHAAGLQTNSLVLNQGRLVAAIALLGQALFLLAFFVPAIVGTLFHLIPFWCVRFIAPIFTTPGRTTISLYRLLVGLPIYVGWYAVVFLGTLFFTSLSFGKTLGLLAMMPLLGILTLHYWRSVRATSVRIWHQIAAILHPRRLSDLRETRRRIGQRLATLTEQYREKKQALAAKS